jgi:hypothetical protein
MGGWPHASQVSFDPISPSSHYAQLQPIFWSSSFGLLYGFIFTMDIQALPYAAVYDRLCVKITLGGAGLVLVAEYLGATARALPFFHFIYE